MHVAQEGSTLGQTLSGIREVTCLGDSGTLWRCEIRGGRGLSIFPNLPRAIVSLGSQSVGLSTENDCCSLETPQTPLPAWLFLLPLLP